MAAGLVRLAWFAHTHYTEEDAFITFRYSRQLSEGFGFVYNPGERLYGTTTPLFTLLLVPWFKMSQNVVPAATALDLFAAVGSIFFVGKTLQGRAGPLLLMPLGILAVSPKLIAMDMQGMETPMLLFFMAASWYAFTREKTAWTGIFLGLLLWTRVDLLLWPFTICLTLSFSHPKRALQIAVLSGLVYLPWLAFSTLYFGSPIPFTAIAKWVAYVQNNQDPLTSHLSLFLNYLSPFDFPQGYSLAATIAASISLGLATWMAIQSIRDKTITILAVFAVLEIGSLVLTRTTFFNRYFVPTLWAVLILMGLELGTLWQQLQTRKALLWGYRAVLSSALITALFFGLQRAQEYEDKQYYRQEESLEAIGVWLNQNTPVGASVLLEPLGYVGYYSNRMMIDEVGLVTPAVVELKRQHVDPDLYFSIFHPDYYVLHCDDAARLLGLTGEGDLGFSNQYLLIRTYNPLNFDPLTAMNSSTRGALARNSCYQIWKRSVQ